MSSPSVAAERRPGPLGNLLAVVIVGVCMVLPMWAIGNLTSHPPGSDGIVATSAAAALGALFRASARNLLRSTLMTAVRATSRALSRRVARALLRSLMGVFLPTVDPLGNAGQRAPLPGAVALGIGFGALVLSFGGVVALSEPATRAELAQGTPLLVLSLLAGVPLLAHASMMRLIAPRTGATVRFTTTLDGLLLQAYFTGAMSFLPLSSDAELDGPTRSKAVTAGLVLIGMVGFHVVLWLLAHVTGVAVLYQLSSLFLIYAFVQAFPMQPLDGGDIWAESKGAWFGLWLLVLLFFLGRMPEAFYAIL